MNRYILDENRKPIECHDLDEWARWIGQNENQRIDFTKRNDVWVSTVFLGLDYNFNEYGDPILYETMIFGGEHDQWQKRYRTEEEAREGHIEAGKLAFGEAFPEF